MALSSKIQNIYIRNSSGSWIYKIKASDFTSDIGQVNFTEAFDEAIDGSLRSNLRGYRVKLSLNWAKLHKSTVVDFTTSPNTEEDIRDVLNDIRTSIVTDGDDYVQVSLDGRSSYINVIPENLTYRSSYTNQIGRASATLDFIGQQILETIPETLEAPSI